MSPDKANTYRNVYGIVDLCNDVGGL